MYMDLESSLLPSPIYTRTSTIHRKIKK
uniref:Uncharacterized protein n=1 Tax=Arundo donax TaxID=35708 RepID=A0A0A9HII1_ARUDO